MVIGRPEDAARYVASDGRNCFACGQMNDRQLSCARLCVGMAATSAEILGRAARHWQVATKFGRSTLAL